MLVEIPLMWFAINGVLHPRGLIVLMRRLSYLGNAVDAKKIRVNRRVHMDRLAAVLEAREMEAIDIGEDEKSTVKKYTWVEADDKERWKGIPPRFDMVVDERYGFILSAFLQVTKRQCKLSADTIWNMFLEELDQNEVFDTSYGGENTWDGRLDAGASKEEKNDDDDEKAAADTPPAGGSTMALKPDYARVS